MLPILRSEIALAMQDFLTDRCAIAREVLMSDEYGAATNVYEVIASDVPCRLIRNEKSRLTEYGLQEAIQDSYRLIVPLTTPLDTGQRVTVEGNVYKVIGLRNNLTDNVFHEALLVRHV